MLWSEFIDGTGCKETEQNYKVYKDLEVMYMNTDMTKEQIYEYGRKLVDNSPSEAELAAKQKIRNEISEIKENIRNQRSEMERYKAYAADETDPEMKKVWKRDVRRIRDYISDLNGQIRTLKWVLE